MQRRGMEGLVARRCELEADCKRLEQKQRDALADVKWVFLQLIHLVALALSVSSIFDPL